MSDTVAGLLFFVLRWSRWPVYLARLRRKLEPVPGRPKHLITEPGMGYRFRP